MNPLLQPHVGPESERLELTLTELRTRLRVGDTLELIHGVRVKRGELETLPKTSMRILKVQRYEISLLKDGETIPVWLPLPRAGQFTNGVTWFSTPRGYELHAPTAVFRYEQRDYP
ncbi:MAG: hypothetical protein HC933_10130 [Pleurocapsa sp. SU_196_0]|nr:hypothetical protein [Pleurocapsa sp. SU_196_0]